MNVLMIFDCCGLINVHLVIRWQRIKNLKASNKCVASFLHDNWSAGVASIQAFREVIFLFEQQLVDCVHLSDNYGSNA